MNEYAEALYAAILAICEGMEVNRSEKQAKDNVYRSIKGIVAHYKDLAKAENPNESPTKDQILIHQLGATVTKSPMTDALTAKEYIDYIKDVTTAIMRR